MPMVGSIKNPVDVIGDGPPFAWVEQGAGGMLSPTGLAVVPGSGDLLVASEGSHQILRYGSEVSGDFEAVVDATNAPSVQQ